MFFFAQRRQYGFSKFAGKSIPQILAEENFSTLRQDKEDGYKVVQVGESQFLTDSYDCAWLPQGFWEGPDEDEATGEYILTEANTGAKLNIESFLARAEIINIEDFIAHMAELLEA